MKRFEGIFSEIPVVKKSAPIASPLYGANRDRVGPEPRPRPGWFGSRLPSDGDMPPEQPDVAEQS